MAYQSTLCQRQLTLIGTDHLDMAAALRGAVVRVAPLRQVRHRCQTLSLAKHACALLTSLKLVLGAQGGFLCRRASMQSRAARAVRRIQGPWD